MSPSGSTTVNTAFCDNISVSGTYNVPGTYGMYGNYC
jgi:hypothetical protein